MSRAFLAFGTMVLLAGCIELFQEEIAGEKSERVPALSFTADEPADQVRLMAVESEVRWSDLNLTADRAAWFRLNDGPMRQFGPTRSNAVGSGPAHAGDKIEFCMTSEAALELRLLHVPQNLIIYEFTFASLATHEWCR